MGATCNCQRASNDVKGASTSSRHAFYSHTYHRSISAFRRECGWICDSTTRSSIGKDDNADAIHPAKLKDYWAKQSGDDIYCHQVDTAPHCKHLQITVVTAIVFLRRQYTCYPTSFESGEAFHLGVPSCELAFEENWGRGGFIFIVPRAGGRSVGRVRKSVAVSFGELQLTPFLNVVFWKLEGIHDAMRCRSRS